MNKKMHRVFAVFMAIMMLVSAFPMNALAVNSNEKSPSDQYEYSTEYQPLIDDTDKVNYITAAEVKGGKETEIENDNKVTVTLSVDYRIPTDKLIASQGTDKTKTVLYNKWYVDVEQLKLTGLDSWSGNTEGIIYDGNKSVGTYKFDGNRVNLEFYGDFMASSATSASGISGHFNASCTKTYTGAEGSDKYQVTVGKDTYTFYPNGKGDISVAKTSQGSYDKTNGIAVWKITVSSVKGTWGNTKPNWEGNTNDNRADGENKGTNGITVVDRLPVNTNLEWVSFDSDGATKLTAEQYSYDAESRALTLHLDDLKSGGSKELYVATRTIDRTDNSHTNYVYVSSKDINGAPIDANTSFEITNFRSSDIVKDSSYDKSTGYITWTIKVNNSKQNIVGFKVVDKFEGATSNYNLQMAKDITVKRNGTDVTQARTGFEFSGTDIVFTEVENGENKAYYEISFKTLPTEQSNGSNSNSFYDKNWAYLYNGSTKIHEDWEEQRADEAAANWITKDATFDSKTRVATYTIYVNVNHRNVANITSVTDGWQTALPDGFTYKTGYVVAIDKDGHEVSGTKTTVADAAAGDTNAVDTLMKAATTRMTSTDVTIDGDNRINTYKYKIYYEVDVDAGVTGSHSNTAQIVASWGTVGDEAGTGSVDAVYASKVGDPVEEGGYVKWTVTLNRDYLNTTKWSVKDQLDEGDGVLTTVDGHNTKITVYDSDTTTTSGGGTFTFENFAAIDSKVNELLRDVDSNDKIVVEYYTTIPKLDTLTNTITVYYDDPIEADQNHKKQVGSQPVSVTPDFTPSVDKDFQEKEEVINESGEVVGYNLKWKLSMGWPHWAMADQEVTITDTIEGNHYMTDEQFTALASAAKAVFGNHISVTSEKTGDVIKKFTISMTGTPDAGAAGAKLELTYCTYVSKDQYYGQQKNTVSLDMKGEERKTDADDHTPNTDLSLEKKDVSIVQPGDTYAKSDSLRWDIEFEVPAGISGKDIVITDNLDDNLDLTAVSVRVGSDLKLSASGSFVNGKTENGIELSYNAQDKTVTVKFNDQTYDQNTKLIVTLSAKAKDTLFTNEGSDELLDIAPVSNTAQVNVNGSVGNSNTVFTTVERVKETTDNFVISKSGSVPDKDSGIVNTVNYTVQINPAGKQFLKTAGGTLTVYDSITATSGDITKVSLEQGSIVVKDSQGVAINASPLYGYNANTKSHWIKLTVPDATPLTLTYTYQVSGDGVTGSEYVLKNAVTLKGEEYEGSDTDDKTVTVTNTSGASASTDMVTFYKVDKDNYGVFLPDAHFKLLKYDGNNFVATDVTDAKTGKDGKLPLTYAFEKGEVYKLVETEAPVNYRPGAEVVFSVGYSKYGSVATNHQIFTTRTSFPIENQPVTTQIHVTKVWNDENDKYKNRPASIKVWAYIGDTKTEHFVVLNETNNWTGSIEGLRKYDTAGNLITYTVHEDPVPGYTAPVIVSTDKVVDTEFDSYQVTNTTDYLNMSLTKKWIDGNADHSNVSVTIGVFNSYYQGGKDPIETVTLSKENGWKKNIKLPVRINGYDDAKGSYFIRELSHSAEGTYIATYGLDTAPSEDYAFEVTNTIKQVPTEVVASKQWIHPAVNSNADATFELYIKSATEELLYDTYSLENGKTQLKIENLPKYAIDPETNKDKDDQWTNKLAKFKGKLTFDGSEIQYAVKEIAPTGYVSTVAENGLSFKNVIKQDYVDVSVTKAWVDGNGTAKERPKSITINLYQDKAEDSKPYATETLSVNVQGDTTVTFDSLPRYDICNNTCSTPCNEHDGHAFVYTVEEVLPEGYTTVPLTESDNTCADQSGNFAYTITNTIEQKYTAINGAKTWIDRGNEVQRPVAKNVRFKLYRDDKLYHTVSAVVVDGNWSYSFVELPKYDVCDNNCAEVCEKEHDGHAYRYRVEEAPIEDSEKNDLYTTLYNENQIKTDSFIPDLDGAKNTVDVKNTIAQRWVDLSITKDWVDGDETADKDAAKTIRPVSITVKLYLNYLDDNSVSKKVLTTKAMGYNADEYVIEPDANGNWCLEISGLPKYAVLTDGFTFPIADGQTFIYTVEEVKPDGYTPTIGENIGTDPNFSYEITNTVDQKYVTISGVKKWIDKGNEGQRPDAITIELYRDQETEPCQTVTINKPAGSNDDAWAFKFDNQLPVYDVCDYTCAETCEKAHDGHTYKYTVKEVPIYEGVVAEGAEGTLLYTTEVSPASQYPQATLTPTTDEVIITNTIAQRYVEVKGSKTWIDPVGAEHDPITVNLLRDGIEIKEMVLMNGTLEYVFENLPKYAVTCAELTGESLPEKEKYTGELDGHTFVYTVTEDAVDGYTSEQKDTNFINTIEQEYIPVSGTKTWIDGEDVEGKRPQSITINLFRDGDFLMSTVVKAAEGGSWSYEFNGLPKYAVPCDLLNGYTKPLDGHIFVYTVTEDKVDGYTSVQNGYDFINTIVQDYVGVSGTKTWIDPVGTEHAPITINLLREGEEIDQVVLENGATTYSFENLPKFAVPCDELAGYKGKMDGHIIEYTLSEDIVPGYTTVQNGTNFINTIEQEWIPVTVNKIWVDEESNTKHPTITIYLLQDGERYQTVELANGETSYTFENLPKYNLITGQVYEYTIDEKRISGYTTKINGLTITNTEREDPKTVIISGRKVWEDDGVEHYNADEVIITLMRKVEGGEFAAVTDAQIIWEGNTFYFRNLPRYDEAGKEYEYTFTEAPVEGYETVYEGNTIINRKTYEVLPVELGGKKYWNDNDNADGLRTESVVVQLLRDNQVIDTVTVTAENGWTYSFTDLPDNDGYGHYYVYTVNEQMVPGYYLKVDGYDLYNTRIPEQKEQEPFAHMSEEELEELISLFDYGVPLWGGLLGTGDEIPAYPFVLGGMGLLALAAYVALNHKRKRT